MPRGVTQFTYAGWLAKQGRSTQPVALATDAEIAEVYRSLYWDKSGAAVFPPPLDLAFFDTCILFGVPWATRLLQAILGVDRDGSVGPKVRAAIEAHDLRGLCTGLVAARAGYHLCRGRYDHDASWWLNGWLARCRDLQRACEKELPA